MVAILFKYFSVININSSLFQPSSESNIGMQIYQKRLIEDDSSNNLIFWPTSTQSLRQQINQKLQEDKISSSTDSKLTAALSKYIQSENLQNDSPNMGRLISSQSSPPGHRTGPRYVSSSRRRHYQCLVHVINCFWQLIHLFR